MNVKGEIAIAILKLIKSKHPAYYNEWIKSLPISSKETFINYISPTGWYPADEAVIVPVQIMSHIIFKDDKTGAWQSGRFNARMRYNRISLFFSKFVLTGYVIKKGIHLFKRSFEHSEIIIAEKKKKHVKLHITKLSNHDPVFENWFAGWMEQSLEIAGCKNIIITIPLSINGGDKLTEILISWK